MKFEIDDERFMKEVEEVMDSMLFNEPTSDTLSGFDNGAKWMFSTVKTMLIVAKNRAMGFEMDYPWNEVTAK